MTETLPASLSAAGAVKSRPLALATLAFLAVSGGLILASPTWDPLSEIAVCSSSAADRSAPSSTDGRVSDREFMVENRIAMTRMMVAMEISPTGDVDRDFVTMMVAHHQGAIDMAIAELRHGHNERLQRMAQEIVVTQGQEIQAMRSAIPAAYWTPRQNRPTAASSPADVASDNQSFPPTGATEGVR